jgi:GT2 family glycosyltransferase
MRNKKEKKEPVTIIIPTHSSPITEVVNVIKQQKYAGKVTIIVLDNGIKDRTKEMPKGIMYIKNEKNLGLAGSLNKGIMLAKTELIITLHQDCIPVNDNWLTELITPLETLNVILSSSQQILPKEVWQRFSFWHKVFAVPELKLQKTIHERATAYRKSVVVSCGLFDNKTFHTAGEDSDLFMKMQKYGRFVVSDAVVSHNHAPHNNSLWKFIKTFLRCHEAMGVLHRKYLFKMKSQITYDFLKTILCLFFVVFLFYNIYVSIILFGIIILLANITHVSVIKYIQDIRLVALPIVYICIWFATIIVTWKGFISGRQTIE